MSLLKDTLLSAKKQAYNPIHSTARQNCNITLGLEGCLFEFELFLMGKKFHPPCTPTEYHSVAALSFLEISKNYNSTKWH